MPLGISELIDSLSVYCYWPVRDVKGPFIFSVDHCFSIKGHGTVMTGTVLSGAVSINDVRISQKLLNFNGVYVQIGC